jgi:hypothetical protein
VSLPVLRTAPQLAASCGECTFLPDCGGLEQLKIFGCFGSCGTTCTAGASCDWTCPMRANFVDRFREIGGLGRKIGALRPISANALPLYVPMVRHGSKRNYCLTTKVVALSIEDVLKEDRFRGYGPVRGDRGALLDHFGLRPDAQVLVVSVAEDAVLERFWEKRATHGVAQRLATLGLTGMTIPNFSFFSDAPRTHTLWNRGRMLRVAEELSEAGVAVALHLNAIVPEDWDLWARLLIEHPTIRYVAKEFQTGLRNPELSSRALRELAGLQRRVGRELHPIIVGGARLVRELRQEFRAVTFVDSEPFIKTVSRRRAVRRRPGELEWVPEPMPQEAPLDELLEDNIRDYAAHLAER